MSLVERAAKRLAELGKAGSEGAGGLAHPSPDEEAAASLIERAVRKSDAPAARWVGAEDAPPVTPEVEAPGSVRNDGVNPAVPARREPHLGDFATRTSAALSLPRTSISPVRQAHKVELDLPMLASAGYLEPEDPGSLIANEFRKIKRPLIQACQGKLIAPVANANRVMVTSSVAGEGKSFVSLNLALSIAMERDTTVLLIDADTTRRSVSRLLGVDSKTGLMDLLGGNQLQVSDALLRTNLDRLTLLPAGRPVRHATELLASETMEHLVEELASRYADRILIFDTPPLLGAPEPAVLATHMGQIIVVVEADRTTHKVLTNALSTVQSCPLVTTILNKATSRAYAGYYYYHAA